MTSIKSIAKIIGVLARRFGIYPDGKKEKPNMVKYIPPRSMTEEEKEYYAEHKNLTHMYGKNHFKPKKSS